MKLMRLTIDSDAGERPFFFPDDPNVAQQTREILGGETYPVPEFLASRVDAVFDIGANIGTATVFFALRFPGVPVYAFEPVPDAFGFLERNTDGLETVHRFNHGLFDRDCRRDMACGGAAGEASSVKASVHAAAAAQAIDLRRARDAVLPLAAECQSPLIKVDTEGCEVEILSDLCDLLPRAAAVYLEYHSEADRRALDVLLTGAGMMLNAAHVAHVHAGDLCYLNGDLVRGHSPYRDRAIV